MRPRIKRTPIIANPKCKHCKDRFVPKTSFQQYCFKDPCTDEFIRVFKIKEAERQTKKGREQISKMRDNIKTKSDWLAELQTIFNIFIRLRDADQPCISCGTRANVKYDAGHFYSRKAYSGIRFDEDNVHKQCSNNCNVHLSGNFAEYSINLPERIGKQRFDELVARRHIELRMDVDDIKEMIIVYKKKIQDLKKNPEQFL